MNNLKSFWDVRYEGNHTNIFIKKLSRFLSLKVGEVQSERFEVDGKKYERSTFYVEHNATDWTGLIEELLTISNKITWKWTLLLNVIESSKFIAGEIRAESPDGSEPIMEIPTGFYSLQWEIREDQKYKRFEFGTK